MIFGAIDTFQTSIQWIMSELIRQKRVMKVLQEESKNVLVDCEYVEESQLSRLHYLDLVPCMQLTTRLLLARAYIPCKIDAKSQKFIVSNLTHECY